MALLCKRLPLRGLCVRALGGWLVPHSRLPACRARRGACRDARSSAGRRDRRLSQVDISALAPAGGAWDARAERAHINIQVGGHSEPKALRPCNSQRLPRPSAFALRITTRLGALMELVHASPLRGDHGSSWHAPPLRGLYVGALGAWPRKTRPTLGVARSRGARRGARSFAGRGDRRLSQADVSALAGSGGRPSRCKATALVDGDGSGNSWRVAAKPTAKGTFGREAVRARLLFASTAPSSIPSC